MSSFVSPRARRRVIGRPVFVDGLEQRRHLAAFSLNVNFQPSYVTAPSGYVADTGKTFSTQGAYQFGWDVSNKSNVVDRYTNADTRHDTFAYLDKTAKKWEVAVSNGSYKVTAMSGDAASFNSFFSIKVENTSVLRYSPTGSNLWSEQSATVNVTDGRLTIASGTDAWNNKINSVSILQLSGGTSTPTIPTTVAPATPQYFWAWSEGSSKVSLKWADVSNESSYVLESSTNNGGSYSTLATLGANATTYSATNLTAGTKYSYRLKALNTGGSSSAMTASATTTGASPAPAPTPIPTPTPVPSSTPSTPSYLWSWSTGASSASLQWANVANESGYRLEQSTNGAAFSTLATVAANTTLYNVSGLSASTNFTFRVFAFNAAGSSSSTSTTLTTSGVSSPTPTPTPPTTPVPTPTNPTTPPTTPLGSRFALSGIVQNEAPASMAIPALRELGMTSVRMWYSINSWSDGPNMGDINRALTYKNAGFTVTLALVSKTQTSAANAKAYFERVAANPTARAAIDFWEIGNEPNLGGFWNGSLSSYVSNYLKPAYEAIHPYGELVLGGGVSWDVNAVRTLVAAGYNNYCDYAGFHPYGESGAIVIQRARDAKAAFGNKPMIVSEWNVQFVTDRNRMASEVNTAAQGLASIAYLNYYFALRVSNTHVGQGGVLNMDGSRNNPFWNTVYSWTH